MIFKRFIIHVIAEVIRLLVSGEVSCSRHPFLCLQTFECTCSALKYKQIPRIQLWNSINEPKACCLLRTANCLLLTAYSTLLTAYYLLRLFIFFFSFCFLFQKKIWTTYYICIGQSFIQVPKQLFLYAKFIGYRFKGYRLKTSAKFVSNNIRYIEKNIRSKQCAIRSKEQAVSRALSFMEFYIMLYIVKILSR